MSRAPATSVAAYLSFLGKCALPCILLLTGLGASSASADVRPAARFADNMVIQQQADAAIWSSGKP